MAEPDFNEYGDRGEPKGKTPDDFDEVENQTPAQFQIEDKVKARRAEIAGKIGEIKEKIAEKNFLISCLNERLQTLHDEMAPTIAKQTSHRDALDALHKKSTGFFKRLLTAVPKQYRRNRIDKLGKQLAIPLNEMNATVTMHSVCRDNRDALKKRKIDLETLDRQVKEFYDSLGPKPRFQMPRKVAAGGSKQQSSPPVRVLANGNYLR